MPVLGKAWSVSTKKSNSTSQQEALVHLFAVYTSVLMVFVTPRYMSVVIKIRAFAHACAWESMVSVTK